MLMAAIEGTIVATAMPQIAAELGGFSLYSWVFSAFLLTQAATIPMFGKLADLYGRKPVFIAGNLVFVLGAALCGSAASMEMLVAFRFLQGAGAGAVHPMAVTLVGDLYSLRERAKIQTCFAGVWGTASVIGPLSGGIIVEYGHWPWIFWLSIPFGLVAVVMVGRFLHERVETKQHSIDYAGASLFFVGLSSLMLVLTQGSALSGVTISLLLVGFVLALALFLAQERRAPEPMMPLALWRHPLIALANGATLTAGIVMIGVIGFLPTYVQGVLGESALVAGFALSAMIFGWPVSSMVAVRLVASRGSRFTSRIGGVLLVAGTLLIVLLARHGAAGAALGSLVIGVALGFLNTTFIVSIQSTVSWAQRGVATASHMLMRFMGNAVGASVFGGVLNLALQRYLVRHELDGRIDPDSVRHLLDEAGVRTPGVSEPALQVLHDGLASGLHVVFWGLALLALVTAIVSWRVPNLPRQP